MTHDVIIIGLGAVGAATLFQLAKRGHRVLGIDRWDPPHAWGSTHGESRITRCGIGEGAQYTPLALRSHEIWRELEAETGETLLVTCGALLMTPRGISLTVHNKPDFIATSAAAAQAYGVPHEVIGADEITRRFPQFHLAGNEIAYWEPGGGYVRPERCVAAQLAAARRLGAETLTDTQVTALEPDGTGVAVRTAAGTTHRAARALLAAGAWSPGLAGPPLARRLRVLRQVLHWYPAADPAEFAPDRFPVFYWCHGPDSVADTFYGFPILPGADSLKLSIEQETDLTADPDALRRDVSPDEADSLFRHHVEGRLPGLRAPAAKSVVCPYTSTPDGDFLVAPIDGDPRRLLVSACSGHGFKHSAGLGERIALELTEGNAGLDVFAPTAAPAPI